MDSERLSKVGINGTNQHSGEILVYQAVNVGEKYEIEIFNYDPVMCSVDSPRDTVDVYFVLSSPFLKIKEINYERGIYLYDPKLPLFLFSSPYKIEI